MPRNAQRAVPPVRANDVAWRSVLIEVVAPDEPILYAEARRWHDASAGVVLAILPPIASRASEVLAAIVAAAGGVPLRRSPANEDQAVENAVARLRAHRIHTVVAMHSQWLPERARSQLAGVAALAGLWLFLVTHEFHADDDLQPGEIASSANDATDHYATHSLTAGPGYRREALKPWRDAHWGWAELRDSVSLRSQLGGVDGSALDAPQPIVGLRRPCRVAGRAAASPTSEAAYQAVVTGIRLGSRATTIVRHVLGADAPGDPEPALLGAAAALGEAGYAIVRADPDESRRSWRDLWRIPSTAAAAVLVLRACRLPDLETARLRVADVAPDGDVVRTRRRSISIPAGGAPFLRAQRLVAGDPDRPFLLGGGRRVGPTGIDRLVREGLAAIGLEPVSGDGASDPTPSATWLLERGIAIRGTGVPSPRLVPVVGGERRCRHSLPGWVDVGHAQISHSQRLCRVRDVTELTPPGSGSAIAQERIEDGMAVLVVDSPLGRATYWRVPTPLGMAWLQSRAPVVPQASAIGEGVALAQQRPTRR